MIGPPFQLAKCTIKELIKWVLLQEEFPPKSPKLSKSVFEILVTSASLAVCPAPASPRHAPSLSSAHGSYTDPPSRSGGGTLSAALPLTHTRTHARAGANTRPENFHITPAAHPDPPGPLSASRGILRPRKVDQKGGPERPGEGWAMELSQGRIVETRWVWEVGQQDNSVGGLESRVRKVGRKVGREGVRRERFIIEPKEFRPDTHTLQSTSIIHIQAWH